MKGLILIFLIIYFKIVNTQFENDIYADCTGGANELPYESNTYDTMVETMKFLVSEYPSLIELFSIGQTVSGKDIWAIKITNFENNVSKPKVLHVHGIHGDDRLGFEISIHFARFMCANYFCNTAISSILDTTEIYIIPAINPDGIDTGEKYNANGVDLNTDFPDFDTDIYDRFDNRQPETLALMNFVQNHQFAQGFITFTGGLFCKYPYDATPQDVTYGANSTTPDDNLFIIICSRYAMLHPSMMDSPDIDGGVMNGNTYKKGARGGFQDYAYVQHGILMTSIYMSHQTSIDYTKLKQTWLEHRRALIDSLLYVRQSSSGLVEFNSCSSSSYAKLTFTPTSGLKQAYSPPRVDKEDKKTTEICEEDKDEKIVGGTPALSGEFGFAVSLQRFVNGVYDHFCGGTLISPTWVLTAAHCYLPTYQVIAVIGTLNIKYPSSGVEKISVVQWIQHPNYGSRSNDVMLLKLAKASKKTTFATPIFLLPSNLITQLTYPNTSATVIGWGLTSQGGSTSSQLLKASVPLVPQSVCASVYGSIIVEQSMLCAGLPQGGIDACNGDSGGALVTKTYPSVQIGIVSFGRGCAQPNAYGVYARLSSYKTFIRAYVTDIPTSIYLGSGLTITPSSSSSFCAGSCPVPSSLASVQTDLDGYYARILLPGSYSVKVESDGCITYYKTVVVGDQLIENQVQNRDISDTGDKSIPVLNICTTTPVMKIKTLKMAGLDLSNNQISACFP